MTSRWHSVVFAASTGAVCVGTLMGVPGPAAADTDDEATLAERYAPVMALVRQDEPCGTGEPYRPVPVDPLFGNDSVALRGPWTDRDLVDIGPSPQDLSAGLDGYALDYPPDPLVPGCDYEEWADRVWGRDPEPAIYAHVATEEGQEGRLALQYYFFYAFNDFNNKHEGDWERIQIEFDAADAEEALREDPVRTVYAQHYGSEAAPWGDSRIEVVDETHPVVYVSAGSHASHYSAGLFLGNSATTGFGCDTTAGPHERLQPDVLTIPSDPQKAARAFPWTTYRGHWGEVGPRRFYEGPTGPNQKGAWRNPFSWSETARDASYPVPLADAAGSTGTGFFCVAVGAASDVLREAVDRPGPFLLWLGATLLAVGIVVRSTSWSRSALPVRRRRRAGEVIGATLTTLRTHRWLVVRLAAPASLLLVLAALLQTVGTGAEGPVGLRAAVLAAASLALVAFYSAIVHMMASLEGERPTFRQVYARSMPRLFLSLVTVVMAQVVALLLTLTFVGIPVALLLLVSTPMLVPVVQLEGRWGAKAIWRSVVLTSRSLRTQVPLLVLAALSLLLLGLLLAALAFVVFAAPFAVVNAVPALVGALVWPFVVVLLVFGYFSAASERPSPSS